MMEMSDVPPLGWVVGKADDDDEEEKVQLLLGGRFNNTFTQLPIKKKKIIER